jgi:hypothetical protein
VSVELDAELVSRARVLSRLFDATQARSDLSEDEAMHLAYEAAARRAS